ncbi:nucleoside phosphatase family-domain-containing protein [Rhodocollybia butyracea]|uniref:Nucleoside phosphatase family-domain-containing protein n=1 Tax=Rhodocollybia butyracea TaxID=206335 RepID=A0A9P5PUF4_9AGAR|nr:nucleoside phosphatase family-domain-containing protein [Rhodocollybia butyracea]
MPAPIANDPWLAGRHFGIVVDAGSSGSRLQIYSWKDPTISNDWSKVSSHTLPKVEKGTSNGEDWSSKVEPGISTFAENPEEIGGYLAPLLTLARDKIPPSLHKDTPLFLLATAGMRLLPPDKQAEILKETCSFLIRHSDFKIDEPSEAGPCGSSVLIITGEEEGLFGWIAVNYLMDGFLSTPNQRTTYGFLDMGGASTQIAFEPGKDHELDAKNLIDVRLRLLDGEEIHHRVFVTTWLGYGTNQARERYVGMAINEFEDTRLDEADVVPDPCLPKNLELEETPMFQGHASDHSRKSHRLVGTGSFEQCMQKTSLLLNKDEPCPDVPCLMNGVHVPPIDFSVSHFIGVSEYWFSSEHVFGLGGAYDFVQYERAASNFCARDWSDIAWEHQESAKAHRLTGDGEVQGQNGEVVAVGKWGSKVEIPRLQMQCFKAAWIANVLHEGIGMPRIVDVGGNSTTEGDKVEEIAEAKGLGRPTFQSMDSVGDIAISWTLGKMVVEATDVPPIVDPEIPQDFPFQPIRPWTSLDGLEDRLTPHLPSSLHRNQLGFSPVLLILFTLLFLIVLLIACPIRRQIRAFGLRALRRVAKPESNSYALEEGSYFNGNGISSRPPSPSSGPRRWLRPLRRIVAPKPRRSRSPVFDVNRTLRDEPVTPTRISPIRSYSLPAGILISRSSSPNNLDDVNGDSSSFSPSRNASQLNLSNMIPRSVSRVSYHQSSGGILHD